MGSPNRRRNCKTRGKEFRYESKEVVRCQSCREADLRGLRCYLPRLISDQKGMCGICNKALPGQISAEIHVDHIHPKSRGGTDDLGNLQATHVFCNRKKNDSWT